MLKTIKKIKEAIIRCFREYDEAMEYCIRNRIMPDRFAICPLSQGALIF